MSDSAPDEMDEFTATEEPPASAPQATQNGPAKFPDIAELTYEDARDQLVGVVQRLESGQTPLDETMTLWERGEALADHCSQWLDRAETRLDEKVADRPN